MDRRETFIEILKRTPFGLLCIGLTFACIDDLFKGDIKGAIICLLMAHLVLSAGKRICGE